MLLFRQTIKNKEFWSCLSTGCAYYQSNGVWQHVVNEAVDDLAALLETNRHSLHIVASARGLVFGRLTFQEWNGSRWNLADCSQFVATGGKIINPIVNRLADFRLLESRVISHAQALLRNNQQYPRYSSVVSAEKYLRDNDDNYYSFGSISIFAHCGEGCSVSCSRAKVIPMSPRGRSTFDWRVLCLKSPVVSYWATPIRTVLILLGCTSTVVDPWTLWTRACAYRRKPSWTCWARFIGSASICWTILTRSPSVPPNVKCLSLTWMKERLTVCCRSFNLMLQEGNNNRSTSSWHPDCMTVDNGQDNWSVWERSRKRQRFKHWAPEDSPSWLVSTSRHNWSFIYSHFVIFVPTRSCVQILSHTWMW